MTTLRIASKAPMGRYALGVRWADGHESILLYRHLRASCPCETCESIRSQERLPGSKDVTLGSAESVGEDNLYLKWSDGHESWFLLNELRSLCRCAFCIGEPERPITG